MKIGSDRRRVIFIVSALPWQLTGGMQVQADGFARELAKDYEVVVLTRDWGQRPVVKQKDGYRIIVKPVAHLPGIRFLFDFALTFWHLARLRFGSHVVVAYQTLGTGLIATIAGQVLRLPTIVWLQNASEYRQDVRNPVNKALSRLTWSLATRLLVQTSQLREEFLKHIVEGGSPVQTFAGKTGVLSNGIESGVDAEAPDEPDRLMYVGRLVPIKGLSFLIEAVRLLPEPDRPSVTFIGGGLVNDSPFEVALKRAAEGLRATFTGDVPHADVPSYLAKGGIFVLPSLVEGMPNVLVEAMAAGLPCIATAVGGVPDIISDGENGLLVPPADAVALASAIRRLRSDAALRMRLGAAGKATVARYSWENQRKIMIAEIEKACQTHSRGDEQSTT